MTADTRPTEAAPESPRTSGRNIALLFTGLMVTMLMASLSQTILSTALPTIVGELGGVDQMTWVITSYILASTIMMPVYGRVSDLIGRKPVLIVAISLFMLGSVLGGLATNIGVLILARVVLGLGGGGLMILSQAAIADVVPARERGKYMGIMGAVFAVSSVAGPLLGGWLTEGPGWRWAFWMNLPLGALSILATIFFLRLPQVQRTGKLQIDYAGMALIAVATTSLVLLSTWAGSTYAWTSPQIIALIVVTIAAVVAFVLVERRASQPVIPLSLFADRNFTLTTIAGLLTGLAMFGVIGYMPTYLQMVGGLDATRAGLMMIPMMAGLLVASIVSGQLVARTGRYRIFPLVGSLIMVVALFLIGTMPLGTALPVLAGYLAIFGIGLGLGQQILTLIVQNSFPGAIVGTATASFNYFKQVGATMGSAVVGAIFASRLTEFLTARLSGLGAGSGGPDVHSLTPGAVAGLPEAIRVPIVASYHDALLPIVLWLIPFALLAVIVLLFVKEKPLATTVDNTREGDNTPEAPADHRPDAATPAVLDPRADAEQAAGVPTERAGTVTV